MNNTGRKPTSATSEAKVNVAKGSMPWQTESSEGDNARDHFKYQYHPGGDARNPPKDAPSALHSVIVPNVNLPKVCICLDRIRLKALKTADENARREGCLLMEQS